MFQIMKCQHEQDTRKLRFAINDEGNESTHQCLLTYIYEHKTIALKFKISKNLLARRRRFIFTLLKVCFELCSKTIKIDILK